MLCLFVYSENESRNLPFLITVRFDWKFTKEKSGNLDKLPLLHIVAS